MTSLARDTRDSMASTPSVVAQELAEVMDLKALAEACGWDENSKEYKDRMASINKKYKALMKMGSVTVSYRVDAGPNAARKRARDIMAPLNNKTQTSTYPLIPHREFPTVVTD